MPADAEGSARSQVFLLSFTTFFLNASMNMMNSLIAIYAKEHVGASVAEVGLIVSAYYISSSVLKIPTGVAIKTESTIRWMLIGFAAMIAAPVAFAFSSSPLELFVLRLLHGFGNAIAITTLLTSVSVVTSRGGEAKAITFYTVGAALGLAVGPGLTVIALGTIGIRWTIALAGLIMLPCIAFALRLLTGWKINSDSHQQLSYRLLLPMLRDRSIVSIAVIYLASTAIASTLIAFAPLHFKDFFHSSDQEWSTFFFGYSVILLLTRLLLIGTVSRWSINILTSIGLLNATATCLILALSPVLTLSIIVFIAAGFSHGFLFPLSAIMTATYTPAHKRIFANSIYLLGGDMGSLLGPVAAAPIASEYGVPAAIAAIGLLPILGIFLTWSLSKTSAAKA
ncbi:MAG: MFS transporter [Thaumarchaeota archaeon]|nr:MFS transporter [Nitrososphaerota archaeon]